MQRISTGRGRSIPVFLATGLACAVLWAADYSRDWQVNAFTAIEFNGSADIEIRQGDAEFVTVSGEDEQAIAQIEVEVRRGTLEIRTPGRVRGKLAFVVGVKQLNELELSGATDVDIGSLTTDALEIDISGATDLVIGNLEAETLELDGSGASDITIAGRVTTQEIELSGAGDYDAFGLASQSAEIEVSGAGNVRVSVSEALQASVSGAGDITYRGSPSVEQRVSGFGSIRQDK